MAAGFAGAVLLVALGVALSFRTFGQIEETSALRGHTRAVLNGANALLSALKDAETDQRGYLLTRDEAFLEPDTAVRNRINGQLVTLREQALIPAAQKHLDALAPLMDAKLAELSQTIALSRGDDRTAVEALVGGRHGRQLMDSIRAEISGFAQIQEAALVQREAAFQLDLRRLFTLMVAASGLMLLLSILFAYLIYRASQQRFQNIVHLETQHFLEIQEKLNRQLQQANATLQVGEEKLAVTLSSIGDAVLATDAEGRVTILNRVAEKLTGWTQAEASGRPAAEIFHIINQETRQPAHIPIMDTLAKGTVQGLANHTVLIARDGRECAIADSCAPIRDRDAQVVGAVLVFRDVTKEYAAQQALSDNAMRIQTILNTMKDGVITFQARDDSVETVNPAAERMFGYAAAELIGQNFSRLIPGLDRAPRDEAQANGLGREVAGRRKDGSRFPVEIAVSEMWLGGTRHLTGIIRDITARKQAEEALLKTGPCRMRSSTARISRASPRTRRASSRSSTSARSACWAMRRPT